MMYRYKLWLLLLLGLAGVAWAASPKTDNAAILEKILQGVEKRYAGAGFSADFDQESAIKAMDITDIAAGRAQFKRPGKMRWTYTQPEPQEIITDGQKLWIYKPEDHQVMVGQSPAFFGDGKGAAFLSDINIIRERFTFAYLGMEGQEFYNLKLMPRDKAIDLSEILLWIDPKTFEVVQIVTYNSYGDETRITFRNIVFKEQIKDSLFSFQIPQGVDVLQMEEK